MRENSSKEPDTVVMTLAPWVQLVNRGVEPGADEGGGPGGRQARARAGRLARRIASLSYPSGALTVLSLLAAFLLFARGWNVVAAA